MTATMSKKIRFRSRPTERRVGAIPIVLAIATAWILSGAVLIEAGMVAERSAFWASMILLAMCSMGFFLIYQGYRWVKQCDEHYVLSLDGDLVSLSAYDELERAKTIDQIFLSQVNNAEYYEPQDSSNLLLHGTGKDLEIPLWSFNSDVTKKILDYCRSRGVQIIGVTNDILI